MDPSISGEPVVGVVIFLRGPLARLPEAAATATQPVVSLGWPNPRRLGPRGARAHRSDAAGRQGEHEDGPGAWPLDQRVGHQIRRRLTPERSPVTMPPSPAPRGGPCISEARVELEARQVHDGEGAVPGAAHVVPL